MKVREGKSILYGVIGDRILNFSVFKIIYKQSKELFL